MPLLCKHLPQKITKRRLTCYSQTRYRFYRYNMPIIVTIKLPLLIYQNNRQVILTICT